VVVVTTSLIKATVKTLGSKDATITNVETTTKAEKEAEATTETDMVDRIEEDTNLDSTSKTIRTDL